MATDFELQVLNKLGEISTSVAETKTKIADLDIRLFTSGSGVIPTIQTDIVDLKDSMRESEKSNRIRSYIMYIGVPLISLLTAATRWLGKH